ncbi:MAG: putative Ig domain-containing protein [Alphaproteobacteria bacterium]|nr:putative Ig domain-containing protein [Alphaproteobacteria bacterium]
MALRPEILVPSVTDGPVDIVLPMDAFAHTRSDAVVTLNAIRINGQPLPQWLNFDSRSGTLTGQPPGDFKGTMVVKIIARDERGQEATITIRINGQPEKTGAFRDGQPLKLAEAGPGRIAFAQQLKMAARNAAIRFG